METLITRRYDKKQIAVPIGTTSAPASVKGFAAGVLHLPADLEGTSLAVQVSHDGVNFLPLYNTAGAIAPTVAASRAYALPRECFATAYVRFVVASQAAARTLTLELAS